VRDDADSARLEHVLAWLQENSPEVLCLQETKVTEEQFPLQPFQDRGWHVAHSGQKSYNGVAILAKSPIEDVTTGFGDDGDESQARVITGTVEGARIISVYVVNGKRVDSDKYEYKLAWLERLEAFLAGHDLAAPLAICGDYNIVPDERDVEKKEAWEGGVLYNEDLTTRFRRLLDLGLVDTFRRHHQEGGLYSWWDYRMLGFPKNNGLRIDHILATPALADTSTDAYIDRDERKGQKPSDHAPVLTEFEWGTR